jgi:transcriptional regulator with XRE-family HTH domain
MRKSVYTRAYKELCAQLVAARHSAGLTQQQLAHKLGKTQSFVAKFEGGERRLDIVEFLEITRVLKADGKAVLTAVSDAI